ncbi:hypothetical protein B0H14DRAFT_3481975 [Mycena olivaceomarginata]|nr:hypothetical protein B0H14DRAFT_3481975 [Mycena olivaceomarginata]
MKPGDGIFTYTDLQPFLSDLCTIRTSGPIPGRLPHLPRPWVAVRKLAMEFCSLPTMIDVWELIALFPALPRIFRVDHLTVALGTKDCDSSHFNHLLSKIGPTLQHLEVIELPEYLMPVVGFCVEPCTVLRTLGLLLRFSTASPENMRSGLLTILHPTASPTLTTLMLKVSLVAPLLDLPWEDIDGILSGGLYSGLQRITVKFLPSDNPRGDDSDLQLNNFTESLKDRM